MLLLLPLLALAEPSSFQWVVPTVPSPVAGECEKAVDLVVGQPVPPAILDPEGNVRCFGTMLPTSMAAGLLLTESWALSAEPRGARMALELDWERERYTRLSDAFDQPTPWLQRPAVQRTIGHVEAVGVMALAVGVYAVLDGQVVQ